MVVEMPWFGVALLLLQSLASLLSSPLFILHQNVLYKNVKPSVQKLKLNKSFDALMIRGTLSNSPQELLKMKQRHMDRPRQSFYLIPIKILLGEFETGSACKDTSQLKYFFNCEVVRNVSLVGSYTKCLQESLSVTGGNGRFLCQGCTYFFHNMPLHLFLILVNK